MGLILDCFNLIGDSLYLLKPVQKFLELRPNEVDCLVVHPGLAFEMFQNVFGDMIPMVHHRSQAQERFPNAIVLTLSAGQAGKLAYERLSDTGKALHISQAYAKLLGIDIGEDIVPVTSWQRVDFQPERAFIAVSPFSKSCTRHSTGKPNKTLDDIKWEYIIRYLRRQDMPVIVIGGPDDRLKGCSIAENEYFTANNLLELEMFLKSCRLLVSVDNGLGHIASVLHTPMISLWPIVSDMNFIGPVFSPLTTFYRDFEPQRTGPTMLLAGIRYLTRQLLNGDGYGFTETLSEESFAVDTISDEVRESDASVSQTKRNTSIQKRSKKSRRRR